jgi:chromate transporter
VKKLMGKEYFDLFFTFFKMGCVTFGGGYAMLPVLEREIIKKKGWATMEEIMDYYTIAQVTPGVIAVNVSTFIGYKRKGIAGGFISTAGFVLPGVTLVTLAALCVSRFADYPVVKRALAGVRIAVAALIADTVIKLCKGLFKDRTALALFVLVFSISAFIGASPVLLLTASGLAGFFLYGKKEKKNS